MCIPVPATQVPPACLTCPHPSRHVLPLSASSVWDASWSFSHNPGLLTVPGLCTAADQIISGPLQPPQGSVLDADDKGEMLTAPGSSKDL